GDRGADQGDRLPRLQEGRRVDLSRAGEPGGQEVQGLDRRPRQGRCPRAGQRPDRDLPGLVLLRPEGLQELRRSREQGADAGPEGRDAARLPGPCGEGRGHQVMRPGAVGGLLAVLPIVSFLAGCGGEERNKRQEAVANITSDTAVLEEASSAANAVI